MVSTLASTLKGAKIGFAIAARNAGQCPLWVKSRHLQCTSRCPVSASSRFAVAIL